MMGSGGQNWILLCVGSTLLSPCPSIPGYLHTAELLHDRHSLVDMQSLKVALYHTGIQLKAQMCKVLWQADLDSR